MLSAFKMKLYPGYIDEYKRRHDELWPELEELLKASGISEYSILLDEETLDLFGVMNVEGNEREQLPNHPVMKKWWAYMKDIMLTNPDNSPVSTKLQQVFYMK